MLEMVIWIFIILLAIWFSISFVLIDCGVSEYGSGNKFKGSIISFVGSVLLISGIGLLIYGRGKISDMVDKPAWENKEVFFWEDVDKQKVIEEWQTCQCSECKKWLTTPYLYSFTEYEYCPHCGSPMKTGGENEKGNDKGGRKG